MLPHKQRRLRIVVVPFAALVAASFIKCDGGLQIVEAIEINPIDPSATGIVFLCIEQSVSDAVPTRRRPDIQAFALACGGYGSKLAQHHAPHSLIALVSQPHAGTRRLNNLLDIGGRVSLNYLDRLVILIEQRQRIIVGGGQTHNPYRRYRVSQESGFASSLQ